MKRVLIGLIIFIIIIISAASCTPISQPGTSMRDSRETIDTGAPEDKELRLAGEETTTGETIVIKVGVSEGISRDKPYPKRLAQIVAGETPPSTGEVLSWFAPLQAVDDSETPVSPFYPAGSRWFLVDATGAKRGKVSIDRFGTIHYLRIGSGDETLPEQFKFTDGDSLVKDFIRAHGGLPKEKLVVISQGFRESAPNTHMAVMFQKGFGHQFADIDIYDDKLEVGISKLYGAHHARRWHEFRAHGKDKLLLDADTLAGRVIQEYRRLWQSEPEKYSDILSGKYLVSIDFEQLVYFDPRPRNPKRFNDSKAIYHPGWLTRVYISEAQNGGFSNGPGLHIVEEQASVGVPLLIVDAHTGEIFNRKPKGDNLFR
ncbi:MAG: hypothetical protein Q8J63_01435 [Candidatus Aquicultor sp.]|nr:hypothetical protein [Candidatus Aquicultor sp.]